jgi:hypothetical protein
MSWKGANAAEKDAERHGRRRLELEIRIGLAQLLRCQRRFQIDLGAPLCDRFLELDRLIRKRRIVLGLRLCAQRSHESQAHCQHPNLDTSHTDGA